MGNLEFRHKALALKAGFKKSKKIYETQHCNFDGVFIQFLNPKQVDDISNSIKNRRYVLFFSYVHSKWTYLSRFFIHDLQLR